MLGVVSSDDRDSRALTPQQVMDRVTMVDVDDLTLWEGPFEVDVGQAHLFAEHFGSLRIALVKDGQVVYGQDAVQAERQAQRFGGRILAIDVSDLGWTDLRAAAVAVGLTRLDQSARVDHATMADMLMRIRAEDAALLEGAGYTDDDLDDLIAHDQVPSLDALEAQYGEPAGEDFWPTVKVKVPPDVHKVWQETVEAHGGDEIAAFAALLNAP